MKKVVKNKVYYLKKNQKLLWTSKPQGSRAVFEFVDNDMSGDVTGKWLDYDTWMEYPIQMIRHEFFKIFTDKPPKK